MPFLSLVGPEFNQQLSWLHCFYQPFVGTALLPIYLACFSWIESVELDAIVLPPLRLEILDTTIQSTD